jgi:hypothetical protein
MTAFLAKLLSRLTYANVMATLTAFVVLAGGTAFAAQQLGKKTVGAKQLKANAVTSKKIKKNAVTRAKIKNGSVDSGKVLDGSLGSEDLNLADVPFSRIVHEGRGGSTVAVGTALTPFPLDNPTYTQAAGENDLFFGALSVTFPPGCTSPRDADAMILADSAKPTDPPSGDIVAQGSVEDDEGTGTVTKQMKLGPGEIGGGRFEPATATSHTLSLVIEGNCNAGSGITATNGAVDVIGVR